MNDPDVPYSEAAPNGGDARGEAELEQLLERRGAHDSEDPMSLAGLVDALRAPGTPEELRGADAASAAFLSARADASLAPVVALAAPRRTRAAAAAVAGAVAVAVFAGGAAAAVTGSLPRPLQQLAHTVVGAPSPDDVDAAASAGTASSDVATSSSNGSEPSSPSASRSASAVGPDAGPGSAALVGLCRAFAAKDPSVAVGSVARRNLEAAASAEGLTVVAYCAAHVPAKPSSKPTQAGGPSSKPTQAGGPSSKPTQAGGPSSKPTQAGGPSSKPTQAGGPTSKPTQAASGRPATPGKPASPGKP